MKVYKVDTREMEVRCVERDLYSDVDSEGDTCYDNTHFNTHREALEKLARECTAWQQINARMRVEIGARLRSLDEEDARSALCAARIDGWLAACPPEQAQR